MADQRRPGIRRHVGPRRRVGPVTLAVAGLALIGAIGVWSAPAGHAVPGDPARLLQCEGPYTVSEPVYSVGRSDSADTSTPEQIVDRWAAGTAAAQGKAVAAGGMVKRAELRTNDRAQISVLSAAGRIEAVVTMARTAQLGWHIEVIHACA
jgi:hypothetical protein